MSEWKEVFLEDIVDVYNKKRKPLNSRQRQEMQGKYPYYGASGIFDYLNEYIFDGQYLLISEDGENLRSRQTPIAFIVNGKFWVNNHAHIIKGKGELMDEYLELYFKYLNIDPWITGAVQPKLNKENLLSIPIRIPADENERIEITKTLSNLDKKITLLRQQNQDLEELAQVLFKRWFVEFEFPNENGEPYKSSGGKMVESELGEIPEGWKVGKVNDIAVLNEKQISKNDNIETIKYIDTGSLTKGVVSEIKNLNCDEAPSRAKRRVKINSILYSVVRPTQCHYGILKSIESNYIASTGFCVIDSINHSHYLYLLLIQQRAIDYFESIANATASTYPTMRPDDIGNYEIIIPDVNTTSFFEKVADTCWQKIDNNHNEIQSLTQLRDTLLPKLMSGELRVKM